MNGRNGFTLAELLICTGIFAIILTVFLSLFFGSWEKFQTANIIRDAHSSSVIGVEHLVNDLRETSANNLYNCATSDYALADRYILFPSSRDKSGKYSYTVNNEAEWRTWKFYYLSDFSNATIPGNEKSFVLVRQQIDGLLEDKPGTSEIALLRQRPDARIMARYITNFEARQDAGNIYALDAVVETKMFHRGKPCIFQFQKGVLINNITGRATE